MLVRRGAPAGRGMSRGWTALCFLSLLSSGFTNANLTSATTKPSTTGTARMSLPVPTNTTNQETTTPSTRRSTSLYTVTQGSNGTTAAISETTVSFTSTSGITSVTETMNSSVQSQTSLATTVSSTFISFTTSEMTLKPSTSSGNISDSPYNSTSPVTSYTRPYTPSTPTPSIVKGEVKCSQIKEVRLTLGICLELNKTSSCEEFKKDKGEKLMQILCGKEQAGAGAGVCSTLLVQSEVKPHCLLLVLANRTEISSKLQLLEKHQSDLSELGIQDFREQDVRSHQSYSQSTLIALVTSGILLAVLGITGYFLMNRRSWSPTGERLGEDPYYTENGGGQSYSSGPEASPEAQGKASVNPGAQENGTGQATSRNGHSARQHVVADTEL
ncbi:hematopoietic progenitor cell antigen CD34 isoform X1 [Camelus ferus]|uniref:Hematopoietic progenitor cell antigen CD34 isoform X1 n=2 Tax=Camelus TaxID=9836 RepID=A0A8B6YD45_CAMFR|nr:hematopoietic progenitor cell antigen CD34 isoform X1 [Camelus ferus]XP_010965496.1 hematopoietic progenitor cell antigen CD34 isoform X1 [Camelus bactrianus]